ncbi:hypothetical protein [Streptomyces sp. NPDC051310]|uniref:hypothetical protein n=1 Tax=Streptomyces sp. NPDC051310 TaxID=3365649 RepID=UPI00378D010F
MRSHEYDRDFRDRAARTRGWGAALLAVAALLWTWCALLLITPYEVDDRPGDRHPEECEARLFTDAGTANDGVWRGDRCADERDWPEALAVLGLSVPLAVAGSVLLTVGAVSLRMSAHAEAMRVLDDLSDRP